MTCYLTNSSALRVFVGLIVVSATACGQPESLVEAEHEPATTSAVEHASLVADDSVVPDDEPTSVPVHTTEIHEGPNTATSSSCAPFEQLAAMDNRVPVPLQPMMAWHQKQNMMEHLVAIQRITDALAREDWAGIAEASALIESSPQMQQMCQHMGAGAAGFTEMALDFHQRADAIGVAARAQDGTAVLQATANTLQACTSCHSTYRQEVVDAATWQARTGSVIDPAMMHGGH